MKKVRFLWRTVWILCVSIIVVIIMFFKQNNPDMEKKTEEYENVVKIMAPYTTHDQRNALNTVARKYEGSHAGTKIQIEYIPRVWLTFRIRTDQRKLPVLLFLFQD